MTESAHSAADVIPHCPYGVVRFKGQTICYEPFNNGWRAMVFGTGEPIGVTPELRAVIEQDINRQREKRGLHSISAETP